VPLSVPHELPEHPVPERLQVTVVFDVPETKAVNCWVALMATVAIGGETATEIGINVIVAVPHLLESATEVALTVAVIKVETTVGAV
jgi:hypothetical protein